MESERGAQDVRIDDDSEFVFRWGRSLAASAVFGALVAGRYLLRTTDDPGDPSAASAALVGLAFGALVMAAAWLLPVVNRHFPRWGSSEREVSGAGPDDLAAEAISAWHQRPVLAAAWVDIVTGLVYDRGGQQIAPSKPFDISPVVLVVTDDEVLALTVTWPGPAVRRVGRWERSQVRGRIRLDRDLGLFFPGIGDIQCRPQNGSQQARELVRLLTDS